MRRYKEPKRVVTVLRRARKIAAMVPHGKNTFVSPAGAMCIQGCIGVACGIPPQFGHGENFRRALWLNADGGVGLSANRVVARACGVAVPDVNDLSDDEDIGSWNNRPETTKRDVLRVLDKAIRLAEKERL